MATTLSEPEAEANQAEQSQLPDASVLEEKVPDCLKLSAKTTICVAFVGLVFMFLSFRPVWHTDVWGHLAYGELVWESGKLPKTEPLMPLSAGVSFVDSAWLTQIIGYTAFEAVGVSSLSFLYAATITACVILLLWRFQTRTKNVLFSIVGVLVFMLIDWMQLEIVRPQLAGFLCFVSLFTLLTAKQWRRWFWFAVPALFALWANLHGSFPVGLAMLAAFAVGRVIDVLRRARSFRVSFSDQRFWRYFLLTELAAVAVLLNPYGLRLYAEVLTIASSPNLASIVEWHPLEIRMFQGKVAAIVVLALMFVYRMTPRRVSFVEIFLLVGFGAAAMWTSRMILWWAPIATYYLVVHLSAVLPRRKSADGEIEPAARSSRWSLVAVMVAWICFGFTPIAGKLLHGRERDLNTATSNYTPVAAVEFLNEHPPQGQLFNTYEWGDYLLWNGPKDVQIFVASHAHLIPREVWSDYMRVIGNSGGGQAILDRYGVNTVLIDYRYRRGLIQSMKRSDNWRLAFDDNDRAVVFVRRKPIL